MNHRIRTIALLSAGLLFASFDALAEEFDRRLLEGRWVELFGDEKPNCHDAILFEHALSDDGKTLTTRFTRNWLFSELQGGRTSERTDRVISMSGNTITFERMDGDDTDIPKVWEIIFYAPGLYRLRADGWETDEGDSVRRRRCN